MKWKGYGFFKKYCEKMNQFGFEITKNNVGKNKEYDIVDLNYKITHYICDEYVDFNKTHSCHSIPFVYFQGLMLRCENGEYGFIDVCICKIFIPHYVPCLFVHKGTLCRGPWVEIPVKKHRQGGQKWEKYKKCKCFDSEIYSYFFFQCQKPYSMKNQNILCQTHNRAFSKFQHGFKI